MNFGSGNAFEPPRLLLKKKSLIHSPVNNSNNLIFSPSYACMDPLLQSVTSALSGWADVCLGLPRKSQDIYERGTSRRTINFLIGKSGKERGDSEKKNVESISLFSDVHTKHRKPEVSWRKEVCLVCGAGPRLRTISMDDLHADRLPSHCSI